MLRWIGAGLIVLCSGMGAAGYAAGVRQQLRQLAALIAALEALRAEIALHMTPLAEVFATLGAREEGATGRFFAGCASRMRADAAAGVWQVMRRAMEETEGLRWSARTRDSMRQLAGALGRFDLIGQDRAIELAGQRLRAELAEGQAGSRARCRSYETVGICVGLAVAVILL